MMPGRLATMIVVQAVVLFNAPMTLRLLQQLISVGN